MAPAPLSASVAAPPAPSGLPRPIRGTPQKSETCVHTDANRLDPLNESTQNRTNNLKSYNPEGTQSLNPPPHPKPATWPRVGSDSLEHYPRVVTPPARPTNLQHNDNCPQILNFCHFKWHPTGPTSITPYPPSTVQLQPYHTSSTFVPHIFFSSSSPHHSRDQHPRRGNAGQGYRTKRRLAKPLVRYPQGWPRPNQVRPTWAALM